MRPDFTASLPDLVVTGATERDFNQAIAEVRKQIAFFGATPAYRTVLELHGWGDLHTELHTLSKSGEWATMATLIDDDVLRTLTVAGERDLAIGSIGISLSERSEFGYWNDPNLDTIKVWLTTICPA